jgi:hypothetical protein
LTFVDKTNVNTKSAEDILKGTADDKIEAVFKTIIINFAKTEVIALSEKIASFIRFKPPTAGAGVRRGSTPNRAIAQKTENARDIAAFLLTKIQNPEESALEEESVTKADHNKTAAKGASKELKKLERLFKQIIDGNWSAEEERKANPGTPKKATVITTGSAPTTPRAATPSTPSAAAAAAAAGGTGEPDSPPTPASPKTPPQTPAASGAAPVTPAPTGTPATPNTAEHNQFVKDFQESADAMRKAGDAAIAARGSATASIAKGVKSLAAQTDKTLKAADSTLAAANALQTATAAELNKLKGVSSASASAKPTGPSRPAPAKPDGAPAAAAAAKPTVKAASLAPATPAATDEVETDEDEAVDSTGSDNAASAADASTATDTAPDVTPADADLSDAAVEGEVEVKKDEKAEKPASFLSRIFCFFPNLVSRFFKWLFGMKS